MRDIQRSGQAAGEVIQQVSDTVFPMCAPVCVPRSCVTPMAAHLAHLRWTLCTTACTHVVLTARTAAARRYKAFIEPCLRQAHIRVTNNFNPFAGFKEPIQILKTEESVTVEMVRECLREMFPGEPVTQVPPPPRHPCLAIDQSYPRTRPALC